MNLHSLIKRKVAELAGLRIVGRHHDAETVRRDLVAMPEVTLLMEGFCEHENSIKISLRIYGTTYNYRIKGKL